MLSASSRMLRAQLDVDNCITNKAQTLLWLYDEKMSQTRLAWDPSYVRTAPQTRAARHRRNPSWRGKASGRAACACK
jgi:hypothetical protein